jgi:hypothetical protein
LEVAKKFCKREDTHDKRKGWFCGFREENDTGHKRGGSSTRNQKLRSILQMLEALDERRSR